MTEELKQRARVRAHSWYHANKERVRVTKIAYRARYNVLQKGYRLRDRLLCVERYGRVCACCQESRLEFLCIDHIDGGGSKHRKEINRWGQSFYQWLRKNNFPEGFQILCHNCNQAKSLYGKCPHQEVQISV